MTDAFDERSDGGAEPTAAGPADDAFTPAGETFAPADEVFTPADLVAAGDALAPDQAIDGPTDGGAGPDAERAASEPRVLDATDKTTSAAAIATAQPGDASLLGLIDRLGAILERSDLMEIEVGAGRTTVILRKPAALAGPGAPIGAAGTGDGQTVVATAPPPGEAGRAAGSGGDSTVGVPARPSVKAPLTGIWYGSPTPGSAPFVEVGRELAVGQVVGLIEAMKLFNEIKSDLAGRVVRVVPDSGTLVKAKQPLIEVDPL
jgi:acetyl-CoA carboxylase biotin carboxyl carrier protein